MTLGPIGLHGGGQRPELTLTNAAEAFPRVASALGVRVRVGGAAERRRGRRRAVRRRSAAVVARDGDDLVLA
jgi:hypothetical protein